VDPLLTNRLDPALRVIEKHGGEYVVSDGQVADAMFADLTSGSARQLAG